MTERMQGDAGWRESTLILLGHGSALEPASDPTLARHAAALAARRLFRDVRPLALSDTDTFPAALSDLDAKTVYLMPMFMSEGQLERRAVVEAGRGLAGRRVRPCKPLGLAPALVLLIVDEAAALARDLGAAVAGVSLVLVGHGSTKDAASRAAILRQTEAVAAKRIFLRADAALLEEPPRFEDVLRAREGPVVVSGFFASAGRHATEDVPRLLAAYARGPIGYTGAIGEHAKIPDVVVQAVEDADRSSR